MASITIETNGNVFEIQTKERALQELARLDAKTLDKLAELAKNPRAVNKLNTQFAIIKSLLY